MTPQPSQTTNQWHSRGNIPHCDFTGLHQSITFRLADSLPHSKLIQLEQQLTKETSNLTPDQAMIERRNKIEQWMDNGYGCCALSHPEMASIMELTLLKFDGTRYKLISWCIMPNHVHVLIEAHDQLGKIIQSWKSYTGRWAIKNKETHQIPIPNKGFWQREYWDRYIRTEKHYQNVVDYIHNNPVAAGLCKKEADWPWSSARFPRSAEPQLGAPPPMYIKKKS